MNSPPTPPYRGSVAAALHLTNSPPTPPYCGSIAAALHLMNSQCGFCREKVLFIALRWMQPDRGMMWQAENLEIAREFPSRHSIKGSSEPFASSARGFSGFCLSFVQFLNNSCSKNKNFSPLMPINCLINSVQFVFNS